jgi:hypothetical protein
MLVLEKVHLVEDHVCVQHEVPLGIGAKRGLVIRAFLKMGTSRGAAATRRTQLFVHTKFVGGHSLCSIRRHNPGRHANSARGGT